MSTATSEPSPTGAGSELHILGGAPPLDPSSPRPEVMDRLVARAKQLYTLPGVAVRVLELTDDPKLDTRALKECIENDPALTTKVLRVVNSSLFGLRGEVSDLNQALALLGIKPLKLLILGFSLPSGLFAGVAASTLGWYWRRTLTKAVAAREISETVWHRPGDEAFIAGLLQDLGMLLLIQELGTPYLDFLEKVRHRGYDLWALETASMGFHHAQLTAALLAQWRLPAALVDAVVWQPPDEHVQDGAAPRGSLGSIVHLAEWIARLLVDGRAEVLGRLLAIGQQEHGLAAEQLTALVETLEKKVQDLAAIFSLPLSQGMDYRTILAAAHARLADVAASAAEDLLRQGQAHPTSPSSLPLPDEMHSLTAAASRLAQRPVEPVDSAAVPAPASVSPTLAELSPVAPVAARPEGRLLGPEAHATVLGHVARAVAACRQARCALSLLMVEIGHTDELVLAYGLAGFRQLCAVVQQACRALTEEGGMCVPCGEASFALILPECDRQMAVRLGNELIDRVAKSSAGRASARQPALSLGVGAATVCVPPKNFPPKDLLLAASRCLYGSHASGGGVVKSIEIY